MRLTIHEHIHDQRWTIALSIFIGFVLSPLSGMSPLGSMYDYLVPVVTMQGEIVARDKDTVTLHIWGSKDRSCEFKGIQGFSKQQSGGLSRDAIGTRLDLLSEGRTKPKGAFDIGIWRFKPVTEDAHILEVYVQHDCGERTVVTQIAKVNF